MAIWPDAVASTRHKQSADRRVWSMPANEFKFDTGPIKFDTGSIRSPARIAFSSTYAYGLVTYEAFRASGGGSDVLALGMRRGELIEGPGRRGLGAVREGILPGPHDNRRPVVPAIQRVAPVAHIALVLGGVGL